MEKSFQLLPRFVHESAGMNDGLEIQVQFDLGGRLGDFLFPIDRSYSRPCSRHDLSRKNN